MTKLELAIKLEKDFQKRMQEKHEMWEYLKKALDEQEEASKIIDDSDQIRALYNRNIEPFNIAEDQIMARYYSYEDPNKYCDEDEEDDKDKDIT